MQKRRQKDRNEFTKFKKTLIRSWQKSSKKGNGKKKERKKERKERKEKKDYVCICIFLQMLQVYAMSKRQLKN